MKARYGLASCLIAVLVCHVGLADTITVLEPNGQGVERVAEGTEFSAYDIGNRWDMSDTSDVITSESGFLSGQSFSNGIFLAETVEDSVPDGLTDAKFFLLYPGLPDAVHSLDSGQKFPIDTNVYRYLTLKIRHSALNGSPTGQNHSIQIFFFEDEWSISNGTFGFTSGSSVPSDGSWHLVTFDLALDTAPNSNFAWNDFASVKGLRIDPTQRANTRVEVDWIRLTAPGDPATRFNVVWSGGTEPFDVVAQRSGDIPVALATGLSARSVAVDFAALPSGAYSIQVLGQAGNGSSAYPVLVNETPIFHFLEPDIRGDVARRYSIAETGNPWGPIDASDVQATQELSGLNYSNPVGTLTATSTGSDPRIIMNTPRAIDTSHYRMLSYTLSVSGDRDIGLGSVARVFWGDNLANLNTSEDIVVQEGLNEYHLGDLQQIPLENGLTGQWTGAPRYFRFDPHEFPVPRGIRLDDITLAPLDTAAPLFDVTWQDTDSDDNALIALFADSDRVPGNNNEVLIASGILENQVGDSFTWNAPLDVSDGEYFLYATIDDGLNQTTRYATGPIAVGSGAPIVVTVTQPGASGDIAAAADEFSRVENSNAWDMSGPGDVPFSKSKDIAGQSISNGYLSGTSTGNDPFFFLLYPGAVAGHEGSNGLETPIETARYRYLTFKVRYGGDTPQLLTAYFLRDGTFKPETVGFTEFQTIYPGEWQVITIDLQAQSAISSPFRWNDVNLIRGLRIDPANIPGASWEFDWFTLTGPAEDSIPYQVRWTATSPGSSTLRINAVDSAGIRIPMMENVDPVDGQVHVDFTRLPEGSYRIEADAVPGGADLSEGAVNLLSAAPGGPNDELRNISTRADVRTGNDIMIGGFIISGNAAKCVVVQGLGPSVAVPAGVKRLQDPVLTLKSGQTTIAVNDNWQLQENPGDAATIQTLGRAPHDLLEAAIYKCLDPGPYTALLTGYQNTTGVGIVAVYDADGESSYLSNISTRSWIGSNNLISIAGFVITGDLPKRVFIRGLGPSMLSKLPPGAGIVDDPQLRLYQGNSLIAANDNWTEAANAFEMGALPPPLPPEFSREPAILVTLPPGVYTAHLLGVGGTTGIGNIAVYDLTGK